jgi:hypothetical protein
VKQADVDRFLSEQTYDPSNDGGAVATADRRRSFRQEQRVPAWLSESSVGGESRGKQQQVLVTDLSLHGVGFRSDEPVERGASHWIVIATDRLHLSTRLRVVSTRIRDDGRCDVGAEFF